MQNTKTPSPTILNGLMHIMPLKENLFKFNNSDTFVNKPQTEGL
jgi:hypothetical protein